MFELNNLQRPCFGLRRAEPHWVPMVLKPSPYHQHTTIAYRDGLTLRKYVASGPDRYVESELNEQLSEDLRYLLPRTGRGKPVLLSAASLEKRGGTGMCLQFTTRSGSIDLYHQESQRCWYDNTYEDVSPRSIDEFASWAERWCADTTADDLDAVATFAKNTRVHVKYREGDVFRFKLSRRLYGYGRIVLDYGLMRRRKEPMHDVLAGKSLACAVYHIVTERSDLTVEELQKLPCLPSTHIMDNRLYYGDFVIIGNVPLREKEDWPILYSDSINVRENAVHLQCGRLHRCLPDTKPLFGWRQFAQHSTKFYLHYRMLPILRSCIEAGDNSPYWASKNPNWDCDLRDPRFHAELAQVCAQMGVEAADLLSPGDRVTT